MQIPPPREPIQWTQQWSNLVHRWFPLPRPLSLPPPPSPSLSLPPSPSLSLPLSLTLPLSPSLPLSISISLSLPLPLSLSLSPPLSLPLPPSPPPSSPPPPEVCVVIMLAVSGLYDCVFVSTALFSDHDMLKVTPAQKKLLRISEKKGWWIGGCYVWYCKVTIICRYIF